MKLKRRGCLCVVLMMLIIDCQSAEPVRLEGFTVKGNKELPEVMHIVPWQSGEIELKVDNPNIRDWKKALVQPLERDSLLREVEFASQWKEHVEERLRQEP